MFKIHLSIPRGAKEYYEELKEACENAGGFSSWNDSGKGNRYGSVTCSFDSTDAVEKFVGYLLTNGYRVEAFNMDKIREYEN